MAMMITAQLTDMSHWAPGTRHYQAEDGTCFAVESMTQTMTEAIDIPNVAAAVDEVLTVVVGEVLPVHQVMRPTVVFSCNDQGYALDMTPVLVLPPGTTHESALEEMGYDLA